MGNEHDERHLNNTENDTASPIGSIISRQTSFTTTFYEQLSRHLFFSLLSILISFFRLLFASIIIKHVGLFIFFLFFCTLSPAFSVWFYFSCFLLFHVFWLDRKGE
jgi:hypothetical protein